MARVISRLLNNTVLGPDGIPNEALKACGPLIAPWLADVARACFTTGYYPRLGRSMTTSVLRKEGKAHYSVLGSYRPIALKKHPQQDIRKGDSGPHSRHRQGIRPATIKPNRGKKEPLNAISTYTTHCYH
jgi:hypothetical protein